MTHLPWSSLFMTIVAAASTLLQQQAMASKELHPDSDSLPTADQVAEACEQRQRRLRSAKFEWKEHRFYAKGAILDARVAKLVGYKGAARTEGVPTKDVEFSDVHNVLLINGNWMKFTTQTLNQSNPEKPFLTQYISSYDGDFSKVNISGDLTHDTGMILDESRNTDVPIDALKPVMFFIRSPSEVFGTRLTELTRRAEFGRIDGESCVVLENASSRLWVDPARGFLVLRWTGFWRNGRTRCEIRISYKTNESDEWVPNTWTVTTFLPEGSERVASETHGTMITHKLGLSLTKDEFSHEFSPGTRVYDRVNDREFIVQQNEKQRIILREEIVAGLTHDQLVQSAPGELLSLGRKPPTRPRIQVLWLINAILAATLIIWWAVRRRARSINAVFEEKGSA